MKRFLCAIALVAVVCFAGVASACPQNVVAGQCAQNYVAPQNQVAQFYTAPQPVVLAQVVPQYVQFQQANFHHHNGAAAQQRANAQAQRANRRANRGHRGQPANVVVNNY